jgi:hypothetical protein
VSLIGWTAVHPLGRHTFAALTLILAAAPAAAFDPYEWAKDDIHTCFTDHWRWTDMRRAEMNAAVLE